jgi:hypothetical protein
MILNISEIQIIVTCTNQLFVFAQKEIGRFWLKPASTIFCPSVKTDGN